MIEKFAKVAENLQNNGFNTQCFASGEEAVKWLAEQIPAGEQVAFGGSMTLTKLNLGAALTNKGVEVIDYRNAAYSPEELYQKQRSVFFAHSYFSSANALTEDGCIVNVDGTGNRVAAIMYGPQNIYFVIGRNKLVADMDAAYKRVEEFAGPLNCKRLDKPTPCVKTGKCEHCSPKTSICRGWSIMPYALNGAKYYVALIDEDLGF